MEAASFLDVIWDSLVWLIGLLGALLAFVFSPVRVAAAVGNAVMQLVMRLAKIRAMDEVVNTRKLPSDGTVKTAEEFSHVAANRAHRIQFYLDLRRHKKAARHGPYGVLMVVEDWFAEDFQRWQQAMRDDLVAYDVLEEKARSALYDYERERLVVATPLEQAWTHQQTRRWRAARKFRLLAVEVARERRWSRLRAQMRRAGKVRRVLRRVRRLIRDTEKQMAEAVAQVGRRHSAQLELALLRLTTHEERRLLHEAQLFRADWLSQELTVECGRTVDRLLTDTPACRAIRARLRLEDLPWTVVGLDAWLTDRLEGKAAISPNAQVEDRMEMALRLHLAAQPHGATAIDPAWIDRLAPPGIFGLAQTRFPPHGDQAPWRTDAGGQPKPEAPIPWTGSSPQARFGGAPGQ